MIINALVTEYSKKSKKNYHPFSNKKVRDIVHPSLFPYIKGISKFNSCYAEEKSSLYNDDNTDYWNREYENSKYQWLPSEFNIDKNGKCKIESYINNFQK